MSRLTRLGSDVPVYFPSIVSTSASLAGAAGAEQKHFTPSPPQKGRLHGKKHHHGGDARVQLEPLRPPLNTPGNGTSGSTSARLSVSSSSGRISWDSKVMEGGSTIAENVATFQELDRKLQFYKHLSALKLRTVVMSEHELLRKIDGVLAAAAAALDADHALLYAVDDATGGLSVTASTKPGVVGFQVSRDQYALRDQLRLQLGTDCDGGDNDSESGDTVSTLGDGSNTGRVPADEPAVLYVPNLQALSSYNCEVDVDSRVAGCASNSTDGGATNGAVGLPTSSIVAASIADESGRTIFIVEVRSSREITLSSSLFAAAVNAIENIAFAFDLKQEHVRALLSYGALENVLLKPPTCPTSNEVATADTKGQNQPAVAATAVETAAGLEMEELQYLQSPNAQVILHQVLAHSRFTGAFFVELHTMRRMCEVLAECGTTSANDDCGSNRTLERMLSPCVDDDDGNNSANTTSADSDTLFRQLVESTERRIEIDLLANTFLRQHFSPLELSALVFLPVPSSLSARSAGVLCLSSISPTPTASASAAQVASPLGGIARALKPFLSSLALAHVLKKKDDDMRTSTLQKKKLIALFKSHFHLESVNDPATLVNTICAVGSDLFNTSRVTLYVADAIKSELWSLSSLGSVNGLRIPYGKGISGTVAATKETLVVRNPYADPRFDRSFDVKFGFKTESLLTFPILDKNGETLGVIQAVNFCGFLDAETAAGNPLLARFDEKLLDVYRHLAAHALRINSSLITFAKVQADYWVNRAVLVEQQQIQQQDASGSNGGDGSDSTTHSSTESPSSSSHQGVLPPRASTLSSAGPALSMVSGQNEVASVHSLLDISGFDEAKRVPRNKWSTFAYACWALGGFLLLAARQRRSRRLALEEELDEREKEDDQRARRGSSDNSRRNSKTDHHDRTDTSSGLGGRLRSRSRTASVVRAGRANSLINRWRRLTMEHNAGRYDELLDDNFDPLSKSILELEACAYMLFDGLMLVSTFRIEEHTLRAFISSIARTYRSVAYHSFYHGFDVALSSYRLVRRTEVLDVIKEIEALSLLVAALGHDADHPGNDNQFEIDSGSSLALCYNDISVLENHHAATTFSVLRCKWISGVVLRLGRC